MLARDLVDEVDIVAVDSPERRALCDGGVARCCLPTMKAATGVRGNPEGRQRVGAEPTRRSDGDQHGEIETAETVCDVKAKLRAT